MNPVGWNEARQEQREGQLNPKRNAELHGKFPCERRQSHESNGENAIPAPYSKHKRFFVGGRYFLQKRKLDGS
jgi:hypothetical protein